MKGPSVELLVGFHPADRGNIFMKAVIVQFIQDPESDKDAAGHAGSKAENIQKRITFVSDYVPYGDFKVMNPHEQTSS